MLVVILCSSGAGDATRSTYTLIKYLHTDPRLCVRVYYTIFGFILFRYCYIEFSTWIACQWILVANDAELNLRYNASWHVAVQY